MLEEEQPTRTITDSGWFLRDLIRYTQHSTGIIHFEGPAQVLEERRQAIYRFCRKRGCLSFFWPKETENKHEIP